jgi:HEAT repeat protein
MLALLMAALLAPQADDKAAEEALEAFKTAFRAPSEADRAKAVAELAAVQHPKVAARLGGVLSSEAATVRIAAAKGLGSFGEPKKAAAAALTSAIAANAKDPLVGTAIFEALGRLAEPGSLGAVHKAFDEKDAAVAKAAIGAAAQIRSAASVDPLVALLVRLEKSQKSLQGGSVDVTTPDGNSLSVRGDEALRKRLQELIPATQKALQDLTGESYGTSEAWAGWWSRAKATFKVPK